MQLDDFFSKLYKDHSGYVYLAFKTPSAGNDGTPVEFEQEFYKWPTEKSIIYSRIKNATEQWEVYFAPALFREKGNAKKDNVLGSYCYWVDFDGNVPDEVQESLRPSIRLQSSSGGHEHWYWLSDEFLSTGDIESVNRRLAYSFGADVSGWDANQILRPPNTRNHKRQEITDLIDLSGPLFNNNVLSNLENAPDVVQVERPTEIPAIEDVVARINWPGQLHNLFKNGLPEGHRSEGLYALAMGLGEIKPMLSNEEILAVVWNADERWGKFKGRSDQFVRLLDIVSKVRAKHPFVETTEEEESEGKVQYYGFTELLQHEVQIDWVWQGLLHQRGFAVLTGSPGVGKSQLSINFACNTVLGKDFLDRTIDKPRRIAYLSFEMGLEELQYFVGIQSKGYSETELSLLNENFLLFPFGESLYLSEGYEQNRRGIEKLITDLQLDGIIIDSLGSIVADEIASEKTRLTLNWIDKLTNRFDCFVWMIHHMRKASGDNKRPNKMADIYGSQYISARVSTALCMWESNNELQLIPLKTRLSAKPDTMVVNRDGNLHYTLNKDAGITVVNTRISNGPRLQQNMDVMPGIQTKETTERAQGLGFE